MADRACVSYAFYGYSSRNQLVRSVVTHAECRIPSYLKNLYCEETLFDGHFSGWISAFPRGVLRYCGKCGQPCFHIRFDCPELRLGVPVLRQEEIPEFLRAIPKDSQPHQAQEYEWPGAALYTPLVLTNPAVTVTSQQLDRATTMGEGERRRVAVQAPVGTITTERPDFVTPAPRFEAPTAPARPASSVTLPTSVSQIRPSWVAAEITPGGCQIVSTGQFDLSDTEVPEALRRTPAAACWTAGTEAICNQNSQNIRAGSISIGETSHSKSTSAPK